MFITESIRSLQYVHHRICTNIHKRTPEGKHKHASPPYIQIPIIHESQHKDKSKEELSKLLHAPWPYPARLEPRLQHLRNTQSIISAASSDFHLGNPCPIHTKHSFESSSKVPCNDFFAQSGKTCSQLFGQHRPVSSSNAAAWIARILSTAHEEVHFQGIGQVIPNNGGPVIVFE